MKRINTWQDAYSTGIAIVDLGDGIQVPLSLEAASQITEDPADPGFFLIGA